MSTTNTPAIAPLSAAEVDTETLWEIHGVVKNAGSTRLAHKIADAIAQARLAAQPVVDNLHGFDRDDLLAIADGLEAGYEKHIDVGGSPLDYDGPNHIESTTAAAARFIRTALAAPVAAQADTTEPSAGIVSDTHTQDTRHPVQPLLIDANGRLRFKRNAIVDHLADGKLNDLARMDFPQEDWEQLAQLIGYSLDGFGTLSYVTDETYDRAASQVDSTPATSAGEADTTASVSPAAPAEFVLVPVMPTTEMILCFNLYSDADDVRAAWSSALAAAAAPVLQAVEQPADDAEDALREHLARVFDAMPVNETMRGSEIAGMIRAAMSATKQEGGHVD